MAPDDHFGFLLIFCWTLALRGVCDEAQGSMAVDAVWGMTAPRIQLARFSDG